MRDIRPDLKERAAAIGEKIAALEAEIAVQKRHLATTEDLLARENDYWAEQEDLFHTPKVNGKKPSLVEIIKDTLSQSDAMTLQEISQRAVASGYDFEGKAPGRAIHFRLVGLMRNNQAEKRGDYWRLIDSS